MANKASLPDLFTIPLESATRKEIDRILINLGWQINEFKPNCNVFTERVKTKEEVKQIRAKYPKGRFPDYVLYSTTTGAPIAVIEAKRIGSNLEKALTQAREYAQCIGAKIIFAVDGSIVEAKWVSGNKYIKSDDMLIVDLLTEKTLHKFIDQNKFSIYTPKKATKTREDVIGIFKKTDDLLRFEGMREGIERFTEFSNLLFLKLIDELEDDREANGEKRRIESDYCWKAFSKKPAKEMLDYINDTILPKLVGKYNHSGDVFSEQLKIKNPKTVKGIVDELSKLTLLDVDSDVKGDAFEYFLKNSVTVGNDLGEYYTPRHIVKLMVSLVNPKFGDIVYDPCCGTGGFLIEAFRHIKRNCNPTPANLKFLEEDTIYGGELTETAKIAKMNMILAGDGHTHIKQQDSLANPVNGKFNVILTNFPFSQKTDHAHLYKLSAKSANSIFLKHVIDALAPDGRAAVVVPDSVLFSKDSDSITVRRDLIEKCDVEAVIQLGTSTFAPYTKQPTSIIVFNKKKRVSDNVWFFELNNDGFSETGKRYPIEKNDIPKLRTLWHEKTVSDNSFIVTHDKISKSKYKLFLNYFKTFTPIKNPKELSEICNAFVLGGTPAKNNSDFYGGAYLWATISDMKEKYVSDTKIKLSVKGIDKLGKGRLVKKGSLLMSFKLTLGKTAFAGADLYTNEAICNLVLKEKYNTDEVKEYLYHVLPLVNYVPFAQRAAKGYTLNKDLLPTVEIPFPDTATRTAIVRKNSKLMDERKEIEKQMAKNKKQFEVFYKTDILGY